MTFHPGKVLRVISPGDEDVSSSDDTVQATLEMWDGNVFTFIVNDEIESDVSEDSIVLVDYRPAEGAKIPVADQKVIKVLKGEVGEDVWERYKDFHSSRKKSTAQTNPIQPSYMG